MNTTMRMGWLAIVLGATLCGCASRPERAAAPEEEQPLVKSAIAGTVGVARDKRGDGIQVNVADDARATEALSSRLAKAGYRVVPAGTPSRYRLQVALVYVGPDHSRPEVGSAEKQRSFNLINVIDGVMQYMPSPAHALVPGGGANVLPLIDMALRATGIKEAADRAYYGYTRCSQPVDALVMRMLLVDGGQGQEAEILTQSYAENVPLEVMVDDSVRTMVWLLE